MRHRIGPKTSGTGFGRVNVSTRPVWPKCSHRSGKRVHLSLNDSTGSGRVRAGRRLGILALATAALVWGVQTSRSADGAAERLVQKEAEVAALRAEVGGMRRSVAALETAVTTTTHRIEARNAELSALVGGMPGGARQLLAAAVPAAAPALALDGDHARLLAPLARIEGTQLAMIAQATAAAEARYQGASAALSRLGLDTHRFVRVSQSAMGGPFEPAGADARANEMRDLYLAWNRLAQLGEAASVIPARLPVANFSYTSGYGFRYDPFTGASAMHAGVDMAGSHGEPIEAAAAGIVTKAGWLGGYGNLIEIDHGRGFATRYGHLSRIQVKVGDRVVVGDQIGRMGSTGRSTGTHLHFEIRVDGSAIDPMPYLRAAPTIAAIQAAPDVQQGGPLVKPRR